MASGWTTLKEVCARSGRVFFVLFFFFLVRSHPPCASHVVAHDVLEGDGNINVYEWGRGYVTGLNWCHVNLAHVSLTLQAPMVSSESLRTAYTNLEHVKLNASNRHTHTHIHPSILPSLSHSLFIQLLLLSHKDSLSIHPLSLSLGKQPRSYCLSFSPTPTTRQFFSKCLLSLMIKQPFMSKQFCLMILNLPSLWNHRETTLPPLLHHVSLCRHLSSISFTYHLHTVHLPVHRHFKSASLFLLSLILEKKTEPGRWNFPNA